MNSYIVKLICQGNGSAWPAAFVYDVTAISETAAAQVATLEHRATHRGRTIIGSIVEKPERISVHFVDTYPITAAELEQLRARGAYIAGDNNAKD